VAALSALPVRVRPAPGESIDSWLEITALAMDATLGAVARSLDLCTAPRPQWIWWVSRSQRDALAELTGTRDTDIEAMTLSAFGAAGQALVKETGVLDPRFPFGTATGSRFCPDCLHESDGRWQLSWRLGWSFACLSHHRLLAETCPQCGERQRRRLNYSLIPTPSRCRCGYALSTVATSRLHPEHPVIEAQRSIDKLLQGQQPEAGLFAGQVGSCRASLNTVRSLTNRALNFAAMHSLMTVAAIGGQFAFDDLVGNPRPTRGRTALNLVPPARAVETAVGVTAAVAILSADTLSESADRAEWLIEGQTDQGRQSELRWCRGDDELAAAIVIKASRRRLEPLLQLRYRSSAGLPRYPQREYKEGIRLAAAMPSKMWLAWSEKLLPDLSPTDVMRSALSMATLLVGSSLPIGATRKLLGVSADDCALTQHLQLLRSSAHWNSISAALIALCDYLDEHGGAIDYERRRSLKRSWTLDRYDWSRIRGEGDGPSVDNFETDRRSSAAAIRTSDTRRDSARPGRVLSGIEVKQRDRAHDYLWDRGIQEPVEWQPPLQIISVVGLL
jgi:hypothetical protein